MNAFLGIEILIGVFIGVLFATIVVLVIQIRSSSQVNKMTFPAYEYAIKKAEHDAQGLIIQAQKDARGIVVSAEKSGHQSVAQYANQASKIHKEYADQASEIHEQYKESIAGQTQNIGKSLHEASDTHMQALERMLKSTETDLLSEQKKVTDLIGRTSAGLESLAAESEHHAEKTAELLQSRITKVSRTIESRLLRAEETGEETLTKHLNSLQKVADAHVAAYEKSRIKLMDAHIEQLVESVIQKVLHTQLPVAEHASLARDALEEAKSKNIL